MQSLTCIYRCVFPGLFLFFSPRLCLYSSVQLWVLFIQIFWVLNTDIILLIVFTSAFRFHFNLTLVFISLFSLSLSPGVSPRFPFCFAHLLSVWSFLISAKANPQSLALICKLAGIVCVCVSLTHCSPACVSAQIHPGQPRLGVPVCIKLPCHS